MAEERDGSVDRISITLERAVQFANSLTHEYVTLEHLLYSIIEEDDVSDLLTDMEVDGGAIAQDVEKVLPQLVTDRDNGFKGVDYAKLTGLLIEAIKDQQKQIEELKNKIS